mmetsp:Transcript_1741/g.2670  ORF Transcript_1741/g.2670 Transcript_1741/m.2670 type:complete len:801 (+) Transcript_1741:58-2460(+)
MSSTKKRSASNSLQPTIPFQPILKKQKPDIDRSPVQKRESSMDSRVNDSHDNGVISADGPPSPNSVTVGNLARKKAQPAAPARKMVIKPFKVKPKLPENFEEETWEKLKMAVEAVHQKKPVACSQEELYRAAEGLCLHKMAGNLYKRLQTECEEHISFKIRSLLGKTPDSIVFLGLVENTWQDHCNQMLTIRSIFLYLDRTYVIQTANIKSLWDMGLQLFRRHLGDCPEVERKTVSGLLAMIEKERSGETVDRSLLKNILRMFTALSMYGDSFEKPFLEATTSFYSVEGIRYMQQTDVPDYLKHVEQRLHEETERVLHYLDPSTRKALITVVETQMLKAHISPILEKGFGSLMDQNRHNDLRRMYSLFSRVAGLIELKAHFALYIKKTGARIVEEESKDRGMVQDLLDFKARLDSILEESFDRNEAFAYALKDAFESFINARQNRPAELIAKFIDNMLRAGNKGTSDDELETLMDKVMTLFRYIQGKDVFEAFYKKDLAKRLLLGKSASTDAEKSMISKLKTECGSTFTNKLEGMFKDIDLSKDIITSFRQSAKNKDKLGDIELHVHVLTTGYWPAYLPTEIKLPKELAELQEVFKSFYLSKYNGRRLMWQNSLGHCVLKAYFPLGRKELSVSLFQAVVLMLFNDAEQLSYKEILDASGIEDKELRRTLQSLAVAKVKALNKLPKGKDINDDDSFVFNREFSQKLYRIKINSIQMKETVEENQSTTERVFQDRQYQVDAAIVRIMKTRKQQTHSLLIAELYNQLKFPIKPQDLKKRIESLIDREYLERDKGNPNTYNYLA